MHPFELNSGGPLAAGAQGSAFAAAGGEMAALITAKNWSATPLGPRQLWPQSLQTMLRVLVTSRYAMWLGWGPDLTFFYNDAYARMTLGAKHPWALGRPAREVWPEIWSDIGPRAETVVHTGEATWDEGLLLFLERSGFPEETYHTFSYSPLPDDRGAVGGMLCVVTEDTDRIIGERRIATLRELASRLAAVRTEPEVCDAIEQGLASNRRDMPFALVWLFDAEARRGRLACVSGIAREHRLAAAEFNLDDLPSDHPAARILAGGAHVIIDRLGQYGPLPSGDWDRPPHLALAVPIVQQGQTQPAGMILVGLNPFRPAAPSYSDFIDLVAAQIASGLASARAYEAERQRAEALAEIDRAKTAFFSNVSHEFRTPLTLMLGPLEEEIAVRGGAEREQLEMVHRNGLRLLRLVNTLLDFSRIEAGRVRATFRPTDLAAYTAELASNYRSACENGGLAFSVDCARLPQPVYVDAEMWERVVLNLVSNAFKYTLEGGIAVALRLADDHTAELLVSDTGVGIPADELPRIFDRFHRIAGQQARTMEGTGIGLALVNELVQLHGGRIEVQSKVGVGTTVRVALPLGFAHLPAEQVSQEDGRSRPDSTATAAFVAEAMRWLPQAAADPGIMEPFLATAETDVSDAGRPKVLLADDNADMRDYVHRLLGTRYDVRVVPDGEAALHAVREQRPDLVLSDVMMPRLDGFGLLAALRADETLRDLPVIMLSARAGDEARVEGLDAGADDYLVKPFAARELLARVRSNLDLARIRREVAERLRTINDHLEQRVAEEIAGRMRTEEELRQAQKMEAIGQLTGGVAHDFNNLLTAISGGAETLRRLLPEQLGAQGDRLRRAVRMIEEGSQRAAVLTQRLLAFARRQTLDPRPLDANRLVAGMSELLRRTIGESVAIETVLAGGLWRTMADPNHLESALLNLAVNARDAMPDGGKLTIETANSYLDDEYALHHQEVMPGQYVMIAISDTGTGMSKDIMDRVFEPFFTTKGIGQGTGLGLSQVYGFIKQSNGHIKIYSEPGQGTVVKLYLPRLIGEGHFESEDAIPEPSDGGSGELILVVEDDDAVRAYSSETLRELGYRVIAAANAWEGLEVLSRYPAIRLLFTDVGLPGGMTGRQLADQARQQRPDLLVLFTTGYARNAIVHGGILDPGTHLLPKPFTFAALASKVRALLDSVA